MDNQNFRVNDLPENNNLTEVSGNQDDFIKLNEPINLPKRFESYMLLYMFCLMFSLSLFVSFGYEEKFLGFLLTFIILGSLGYLYIYFLYESITYIVTNNSLTVNSGIFIKRSKTILFDTIQTMEFTSGILMTMFGIVDFKIKITSPSNININRGQISKFSDASLVLTRSEVNKLTQFITSMKNKQFS